MVLTLFRTVYYGSLWWFSNTIISADYDDIGQYYCQGKNYVADGEEQSAQKFYNLNAEVNHTVSFSTGYVGKSVSKI